MVYDSAVAVAERVSHPPAHPEQLLSTRYPVIGLFPVSNTLVENTFQAITT